MKLWLAAFAAILMLASSARADLRNALEAAFAAGNIKQLMSIIASQKDVAGEQQVAAWTKEKIATGEAPAQTALLAASAAMRVGKPNDALMYVAYYGAQALIDGSTCADKTAGGNKIMVAMLLFHKVVEARHVSPDRQRDAVERALNLENATAGKRMVDRSLCEGGLGSYARDLHLKLPAPANPAGLQQQDKVPPLRYVDSKDWRENRAKVLPRVKEILLFMAGDAKQRKPSGVPAAH